jgi:hypothetical protein
MARKIIGIMGIGQVRIGSENQGEERERIW